MHKYIFYSSDGQVFDINGKEVDNCQIIGWAYGSDAKDAFF